MRKKNVVWVIPQMVCMAPQPPPPRPPLEVINGNAVVYMYVKWKEKLVALRVCFSLEIVISCWCSILYLGFMIYNDRN